MVSDSELWWDKYYQGNTKQYLDLLLNQNNPQGTKLLATNQRQVYDRLPIELRWNEEEERSGTAYSGIVLDYLVPAVTVEPITPVTTVQEQQDHLVTISAATNQIISDITTGILQAPNWFHNNIDWLKGGQLSENDFLTSFHNLVSQNIIHEAMAEPEPEPALVTDWYWVTKPSGIIERMKISQNFINTMTAQGWIFATEEPSQPQPENENISVIFYTGTGGDLKTHFNINSIIVTPEEKEELAGWLYQNYGTSILLVVNRLTNDIRTHTAQQVKAYVLQKIQDDTPEPVLPTPTTPTTPTTVPPTITGKAGIMGAGVAGAIALLILGGFIIDSRKK